MTAAELGSISTTNRHFSWRCRAVFTSNRPGHWRFGPFRVLKGPDSCLFEVDQSLQVVAGRHHRHRKVGPRLTDSAQQLAAHLLDSAEHVLDPCARLGNTFVASLLALGQQLVALALPLNLVSETVLLEPGFTLLRRVASIGIDITTRVARVKDVVKVLAVVRGGGIGLNPAVTPGACLPGA